MIPTHPAGFPTPLTSAAIVAWDETSRLLEAEAAGGPELDARLARECPGLLIDDRPFTYGSPAHAIDAVRHMVGCGIRFGTEPMDEGPATISAHFDGEPDDPFFLHCQSQGVTTELAAAALATLVWVSARWPSADTGLAADGRLVLYPYIRAPESQTAIVVDAWHISSWAARHFPDLVPATTEDLAALVQADAATKSQDHAHRPA